MKRNLILAISLTLIFFILTYFFPVWERTPGGFWLILIYLTILITVFWIFIRIIIEIIQIINRRNFRSGKNYLPLLVLIAGNGILLIIPFDIEDKLYGKVNFRACYEGTQNQATFKIRDNNRFEIHYTGVFFYDKFVRGEYKSSNDTLYLTYYNEEDKLFGKRVFMDDSSEYLIPIKGDTLSISRRNFYYGYCKGLN